MKYLKAYEDTISKPQIGDYVLMRSESGSESAEKYINSHIGKISEWYHNDGLKVDYGNEFKKRIFSKAQIVEFAPTIEELELKLAAKKYNI